MKKLLILLTFIIGLGSCQKECLCPETGSIPFVYVFLSEYTTTSLDKYQPIPDVNTYRHDSYWFEIKTNTVNYCSTSGFEVTDSTAMILFSKQTLTSLSDNSYSQILKPGFNISITTSPITGVAYYNGYFDWSLIHGALSIGGTWSASVSQTDTFIMDDETIMDVFSNYDLTYDNDGNLIYYDYEEDGYLPVPDYYTRTKTSRIYLENVGLFRKEDLVSIGECEFL